MSSTDHPRFAREPVLRRGILGRAAALGAAVAFSVNAVNPAPAAVVGRPAPLILDAPRNMQTTHLPLQLLSLDLDGDGDNDVAVVEEAPMEGTRLELFENPGDGTLKPRATLPLPAFNGMVSGDFNRDGRLDLAQVLSPTALTGELRIYVQNGAFSFAIQSLPLPFPAITLVAGDLDGRFGPDLVIGDDTPGARVTTYFSDAQGAFVRGQECRTEAVARDTNGDTYEDQNQEVRLRDGVIGDFNGDGRNDLLLSNEIKRFVSQMQSGPPAVPIWVHVFLANVVILFGQADGRLGPWELVADPGSTPGVGPLEGSLAAGDLDGDADLDFVTISGAEVVELLNDGNGRFPTVRRLACSLPRLARDVTLVDVDLDGDWDVAAAVPALPPGEATDYPTARWALLRNAGAGTFGTPETYPTGADLAQLVFAELDGIPGPEALTISSEDRRLAVNRNWFGHFQAPRLISLHSPGSEPHGTTPLDMGAGDFNNDGRTDVAVVASTTQLPREGPARLVFVNGGPGGLSDNLVFLDLTEGVSSLTAAPVAGSPATDIVTCHVGQTLAGLPNGYSLVMGGTATLPVQATFVPTPAGPPVDVATLDLDRNGTRDLAILLLHEGGGTARILLVSVGLDGTRTNVGELLLGSDDPLDWDLRFPDVLAAGDMDGDGWEDLVVVTSNMFTPYPRLIDVILHRGGLDFVLAGEFEGGNAEYTDLQLADVNGDGRLDLILPAVTDVTSTDRDGWLDVIPQRGGGVLGTPVAYRVGSHPSQVAVAEFNGRPGVDLAVASDHSNEVTILNNDGTGAFPTQDRYLSGGGTDGLVAGDFDGDGWVELAVMNHDDELGVPVRHTATLAILEGVRPDRPAITLWGAGQPIPAGDATPDLRAGTDFGLVVPPGTAVRRFSIRNLGAGPLHLTGTPAVAIDGPQASEFRLATPPNATIAAGAETSFEVQFTGRSPGLRTAQLTILSDAPNAPTFTFLLRAQVTGSPRIEGIGLDGNRLELRLGNLAPGSLYAVERCTSIPDAAWDTLATVEGSRERWSEVVDPTRGQVFYRLRLK